MKTVTVVCASKNKAAKQTKRILDRYLPRIGHTTWEGEISSEGIADLQKSLRTKIKISRNVAVVCRCDGSPVWYVGSRVRFDSNGHFATGHRKPQKTRCDTPAKNEHIATLRIVVKLGALFHDVGKATQWFQEKLEAPTKDNSRDWIRHEILSAMFVKHIIGDAPDDQTWLTQLVDNGPLVIKTAYAAMLKEIKGIITTPKPDETVKNITETFVTDHAPIGRALHWLVMSHHKIPNGRHGSYNQFRYRQQRDFDKSKETKLIAPNKTPFYTEIRWLSAVKECAVNLLAQNHNQLTPDILGLVNYGRLALMLSDKYESGAATTRISASSMCNHVVAKSAQYDDKGEKYTVSLADHLVDEATLTAKILGNLFQVDGAAVPTSEISDALFALSSGRYFYQNEIVRVAKTHDPDHGLFVINTSGTGTGKTISSAKLMAAIQPNGIRYTYAQGLRSLTFQAGMSHRDDLGFQSGRHIGIRVGSQAATILGTTDEDAELCDDVTLLDDEIDVDQPPVGLIKIGVGLMAKNAKYMTVPILLCTIDSLMGVADGQMGGQAHHYIRVMTAPLIIDEIDDFSEEDQCAIGRLIRAVGSYGQKLVIASATLPPATVEAYFKAYSDGYKDFCVFTGKTKKVIDVMWVSHETETIKMRRHDLTGQQDDISTDHKIFGSRFCALIAKAPVRRKVDILRFDSGDIDLEYVYKRVTKGCRYLHEFHHEIDEKSGVRVSVGAIRWANTKHAIQFSRYLLNASEGDDIRVVCFHSKFLGATRYWIEKELEKMLMRKGGQKPSDHPAVRTAIDQVCTDGLKDLIIVISTSPIIEVGRDYDLDWGICDPSGERQLIQFGGRIGRHRELLPQCPNILLLEKPIRAILEKPTDYGRAFLNPGVETLSHDSADHGDFPVRKKLSASVFDMAAISQGLDARARISEENGSLIGTKEQEKLRYQLFDSRVSLRDYLNAYPISAFTDRHPMRMRFRRETMHSFVKFVMENNGKLNGYKLDCWPLAKTDTSISLRNESQIGRMLFDMPHPNDIFEYLLKKYLSKLNEISVRHDYMSCTPFGKNPVKAVYSLQLGLEES